MFIDGTANIDSLVADTADINGGTIDGVTIGGASAGAATFTDMTSGNIRVGVTGDNEIDTTSGNLELDSAAGTIVLDDNISVAGVSTFSSNVYLQKADAANLYVGSTNAGGAALFLDGDSNGDWSGSDYSIIRHDTDGNLVLTANSPGSANVYIKLGADGDYGAMFKEGAESLLRWDNSTKIQTDKHGVILTGVTTSTTFSVGDGAHDADRISIGDSNDLALYHNASNSFIVDRGTGPLYIRGNAAVRIESYTNDSAGEPMVIANSDSSVDIYYDNVKKFATSGVGATVYGTGALNVPVGTTAERPTTGNSPQDGDIRYNSTLKSYEGYGNSAWGGLGGGTEIDTSVSSTSATSITTFAHAEHRSAYFRVQIVQGSAYQVGRYLLIHDGLSLIHI